MEEMLNRINHKINATDIVNETCYFTQPTIQMVLVKQQRKNEKYVIGVIEDNNFNKPYLVRPHKKKTVTSSIHYDSKSTIDECMEGYVLFCLNNNYKISFLSMPMHISIWEYIETYCDQLQFIIEGVKEYLKYCKEIGIQKEIIDYYGDTKHEDLYAIFLNNTFNEYNILLKQDIGDSYLILGYQYYFSHIILYTVLVVDNCSNQIKYKERHRLIDSAVTDFMRFFYDLSITFYQQKELNMNETIHNFKEFIEENDL